LEIKSNLLQVLFYSKLKKNKKPIIMILFLELFDNLISLIEYFKDEPTCIQFLERVRWGEEPICPHCSHNKINRYSNNLTLRCKKCDKKFNVKTNTIFERTHVPLKKWFISMYLLTNNNKGISSLQLSKDISVTQKTAWFMLQRIRYALKSSDKPKLEGIVEVDETYVGGLNKNKHYKDRKKGTQGRSIVDKIPVFGIVQRGGRVISMVVPDVQRKTLTRKIYQNVKFKSSVMSDEWWAYKKLHLAYKHKFVQHGAYEYVNGEIHTNTIEGYWSQLKKSIRGIYHWVSRKHIQFYCYESDFRYNERNTSISMKFQEVIKGTFGKRLMYKELIKT